MTSGLMKNLLEGNPLIKVSKIYRKNVIIKKKISSRSINLVVRVHVIFFFAKKYEFNVSENLSALSEEFYANKQYHFNNLYK